MTMDEIPKDATIRFLDTKIEDLQWFTVQELEKFKLRNAVLTTKCPNHPRSPKMTGVSEGMIPLCDRKFSRRVTYIGQKTLRKILEKLDVDVDTDGIASKS